LLLTATPWCLQNATSYHIYLFHTFYTSLKKTSTVVESAVRRVFVLHSVDKEVPLIEANFIMFSSTVTTMKQQRGLLAVLVLQSVLLLLLQFPESCTAFVVPVTTTLLPKTSAALHISSADSDKSNDDSKKSTPTMASTTTEDTSSSALYSSSSSSADDKSLDNSSTKNLNYFDKLFEEENDQIFQKYDIDNSGTIDKTEFKMVVKKMNKESRRRELFSIGSATLGSLFVASSSTTFQYGQKKLRSKYLEPKAELAMKQNFPTALLSGDCEKLIFKTLNSRGFTPTNTLLGHSVCSDEVNTRGEQIIPLMIDRWNKKGFALGGKCFIYINYCLY
jgi:hypothetical protein